MPLRLDADLSIEVDGRTLHLQGSGRHLRLRVDALRPLLRLAVSRRNLSLLAETLSRQGLTLDVVDAHGPLITLGWGTDSRLGGWLTSSPRIALRRPVSLLWRLWR